MIDSILKRYLRDNNIELNKDQYTKVYRDIKNTEALTLDTLMTVVASAVDTVAFNSKLKPSDYYNNLNYTKDDVLSAGDLACPKCQQNMYKVTIANDCDANYCFNCRITLPVKS